MIVIAVACPGAFTYLVENPCSLIILFFLQFVFVLFNCVTYSESKSNNWDIIMKILE